MMKKATIYLRHLFLFLVLLVCVAYKANAQIKIGTNPKVVYSSSLLELESQNKGLLLSRLSDTSLINTLNPPDGMVTFYNGSTHKSMMVRKYNRWVDVVTSDSVAGYINSMAKSITSASPVLTVDNGNGAVLQNVIVDINPVALGHLLTNSPVLDSLAKAVTIGAVKDSIRNLIKAGIANNSTNIDSAIAVSLGKTPVKDSLMNLIGNNAATVDNGLSKTGQTVELGGNLNKPTSIVTSTANTLALKGLGDGNLATDSLLVLEAGTGVLKKVASSPVMVKQTYAASAGQTNFTTPANITNLDKIHVYRNGVMIEFIQVDNTHIKLSLDYPASCLDGDEIKIIQYF